MTGISTPLTVYPSDQGIEGAFVGPSGAGLPTTPVVTDATGHFRVEGLVDPTRSVGESVVTFGARKDGYWPNAGNRVTFDPTRVHRVVVPDIPLVEMCTATISVRGTVVDQDGQPVAGSSVGALRAQRDDRTGRDLRGPGDRDDALPRQPTAELHRPRLPAERLAGRESPLGRPAGRPRRVRDRERLRADPRRHPRARGAHRDGRGNRGGRDHRATGGRCTRGTPRRSACLGPLRR